MFRVRHLILNEGFSPNHHFQDGTVPLQIAVEKNNSGLVQFLLEMKAYPDLKSNKNQTPIGIAIINSNLTIVKMLLNFGARVELTDSNRRTPLHLASCAGLSETVQTLIQFGASVNAEDRWGRTPLHVALYNLPQDADTLLLYTRTILLLLARGAGVNKKDKCDSSPLFLCASAGNHAKDLCRMLLSKGAKVNQTNGRKITPFRMACMKGHTEICKVLLEYNCIVDTVSLAKEKYCIDIALEEGHINIVKLLMAAGHTPSQLVSLHKVTCDHAITKLCCTPQSLQVTCRKTIRMCLGAEILRKVSKLLYPTSLKDYILLKDVL